jgi:hypothetical protein
MSKNNIQDVGLLAKGVHYYCLSVDHQNFSMFSLSKVSKLYFQESQHPNFE